MGRRNGIETLLEYVEKVQFEEVRRDYESAINTRELPKFLPVRIKNLCENLRSVLDYIAQEMWDLYGDQQKKRPKKLYFPIRDSHRSYEEYMRPLFPDLEVKNPEVWEFLKRMQPVPGSSEKWLGDFNELNNRNKHFDLALHVSRSAPIAQVATPKLGPIVHLDEKAQEWVEFRFTEPDVNALMLIHSAMVNVRFVECEILSLLPSIRSALADAR